MQAQAISRGGRWFSHAQIRQSGRKDCFKDAGINLVCRIDGIAGNPDNAYIACARVKESDGECRLSISLNPVRPQDPERFGMLRSGDIAEIVPYAISDRYDLARSVLSLFHVPRDTSSNPRASILLDRRRDAKHA